MEERRRWFTKKAGMASDLSVGPLLNLDPRAAGANERVTLALIGGRNQGGWRVAVRAIEQGAQFLGQVHRGCGKRAGLDGPPLRETGCPRNCPRVPAIRLPGQLPFREPQTRSPHRRNSRWQLRVGRLLVVVVDELS
jgi:hypothetical protein